MSAQRNLLVALLVTLLSAPAPAAPPKGRVPRVTRAEFEQLQQEVAQQRKLLEKIVQLQQEHVRALTQLLNMQAVQMPPVQPQPDPVRPPPGPVRPPPGPGKPPVADPVKPPVDPVGVPPPTKPAQGSVVGEVVVRGGSAETAWVYIETGAGGAGKTVQMTQKNKAFSPNVLVVQRGTRVEFPNMDPIFHNVFSLSQGNAFDLGTYKQGTSKGVVMTQPGVVSVYCNIHPQMIGFILVVPGRTYARVGKEGYFHLENLPPGKHRVAAWAPNAQPVTRDVTVAEDVVNIELTLTVGAAKPHTRKDGSPYGSYNE